MPPSPRRSSSTRSAAARRSCAAPTFVDVRLARWCFDKGIDLVCLPRAAGWLTEERFDERIYDFTRGNPERVVREVATYAFRNPRRGTRPAPAGIEP